MEQCLAPRAEAMGEVGVRVTGEQHALEEHQAGRPNRRRAAKPRQDLLGDDRLNQEQQEGGEEDRRRVRQARQQREADYKVTGVQTCRSEEHTSELQSPCNLVCRLLLEKKKKEAAGRAETPSTVWTLRRGP